LCAVATAHAGWPATERSVMEGWRFTISFPFALAERLTTLRTSHSSVDNITRSSSEAFTAREGGFFRRQMLTNPRQFFA